MATNDEVLVSLLTRIEKRLEKRLDFIIRVGIMQSIVIALLFAWNMSIESRIEEHVTSGVKIEQSISNDSKQEKSKNFVETTKRNINGVNLEGLNNNELRKKQTNSRS